MKTILVGRHKQPVCVDDDFELPKGFTLSVGSSGHVKMLRTTGKRRPSGSYIYEEYYLARYVANAPEGRLVLVIDRDKLNMQRENLLLCEPGVSVRAQGGIKGRFKGAHWSKKQSKWIAQITHNYRCYSLGSFDTEEHAASAYNHAAVRLHGAHAYINHMPEDQQ